MRGKRNVTVFVRAPFGIFELRWRRKAICHEPGNGPFGSTQHDYGQDEILNFTRWPEDGWQVIDEAEARRIIGEWKNCPPPTQAEWDNCIGDGA